jgi:hypothetical protein
MMGKDVRNILMPIAILLVAIQLVGVVCTDRVLADEMRVVNNDANSRFMALVISKAIVIELPTQISDVLIADPNIATAVVKTPRQVYLIGLSVGATNVYFFDAHHNPIDGLDIAVLPKSPSGEALETPTFANSVTVFYGPLVSQSGAGSAVGPPWGEFITYRCTGTAPSGGCATAVQPGATQPPGTQNINITGNGAGSVIVPGRSP